jgi:hypothetical protein
MIISASISLVALDIAIIPFVGIIGTIVVDTVGVISTAISTRGVRIAVRVDRAGIGVVVDGIGG